MSFYTHDFRTSITVYRYQEKISKIRVLQKGFREISYLEVRGNQFVFASSVVLAAMFWISQLQSLAEVFYESEATESVVLFVLALVKPLYKYF